jgi:hypothetical protein
MERIMKPKKLLTVIGLVGILLLGLSAVGAQDATATPQPESPGLRAARIVGDIIVQETGLSLREIQQQVQQGQTLAEIIEANGGDVQSVIDQSVMQLTDAINQAVKNGTITQTRADALLLHLQDVVTRAVNGELFPNRLDRGAVRRQADQILLRASADATGLRIPQILEKLAQGSTLADVITTNGATVDSVVNAAVVAATEQINAAVKDNRLTQGQADTLISALPTFYTNAVNGHLGQQAVRLALGAAVIRLAAQQTGLKPADIRQELRSGKTLAAILTEHGVDTQAFIDSAVAQVQARLNQAVANHHITQARADAMVETFRNRLTERINQNLTPEATAISV